jgi:hypothetical protein
MEGCTTCITNQGSPLWLLGVKTERDVTFVSGQAGSQTEIFGGLFYIVIPAKPEVPLFAMKDSRFAGTFVEEVLSEPSHYTNYIVDTTTADTQKVPEGGLPRNPQGRGKIVPLLQDVPPGWEQTQ